MDRNDFVRPIPEFVSLEEAAQIFARDLPSLCDAQLAQTLTEARKLGTDRLAEMLASLARAELARRRTANPPVPRSLPEDFPTARP